MAKKVAGRQDALRQPKRKGLGRKALIGAKLLKRDPVANTVEGIKILIGVAKQRKRKYALKKAFSTLARILRETPRDGRKMVRRLVQVSETQSLSIPTVCRIFAAPLAFTTLRAKLRSFARKHITFVTLMKLVEEAYEKQVPREVMHKILHCEQGKFYHKICGVASEYDRPKSLITNATIKRMHILKRAGGGITEKMIEEANQLKWQIHTQAHEMYKAERVGDKAAQTAAAMQVEKLEKVFNKRFTKNL